MTQFIVARTIEAPAETVFATVSDLREMDKALPHIVRVEFLTEHKTGLGARFREVRLMGGQESTTELEVTEYAENESVRMVSVNPGTTWDSIFVVAPKGDGSSTLQMTMDAIAHKWTARVINFLTKGMIMKAIENDLDLVKKYCEKIAASGAAADA